MPHYRFTTLRMSPLKTAGLLLAVLVITGSLYTGIVHKHTVTHAFTLATTHQPERFTELYFNNSAHLPLYAPAGKLQHIAFHISNHEARSVSYDYVATIADNGNVATLVHGRITLADTQSHDVPFSFSLPVPNSAAQISVTLTGHPEHLTFKARS